MAPVKTNESFSSIRTPNFPSFAGASNNTTYLGIRSLDSMSTSYTLTTALLQ